MLGRDVSLVVGAGRWVVVGEVGLGKGNVTSIGLDLGRGMIGSSTVAASVPSG